MQHIACFPAQLRNIKIQFDSLIFLFMTHDRKSKWEGYVLESLRKEHSRGWLASHPAIQGACPTLAARDARARERARVGVGMRERAKE